MLLDRSTQGTRAEISIRSLLDQEILRFLRNVDLQAMLDQPLGHLLQFQLDDQFQVLPRQRTEDDHVIEAADELRPEVTLDLLHERVLHLLVALLFL